MLNFTRSVSFWTFDFLMGGKVKTAYKDLKKYYHMDSTSSEIIKYQEKSIYSLLKQATKYTTFYREYRDRKDLSSFPVINKGTIVDRQNDFLSVNYKKENLYKMSTSGSTGTPLTSYQNKSKKRRVNAETVFFNGLAGYKVGSKLLHLRSLNIKSKKTKVKQWIQNEQLIDIDRLDDKALIGILNSIERAAFNKSITILSYASTYDALRHHIEKNGFNLSKKCNIKGIISTSEIFFDKTRQCISRAFKCDGYSRYANMENGMLAQDTPENPNIFILNEANYYIEILNMNSDTPANFGEVGRIVVTDLYNYAMPMIRYDTGDIGAFTYVKLNGKKKKAIKNFGGRKIDVIFDVLGNMVSPHKISVAFWNFSELKEFQFIQENDKQYTVLLNYKNNFNKKFELDEELRSILGQTANIEYKKVESIPVLDSGKRKYIMNKTI